MSETKQITGVCQGVTEKPSGWTEFAIDGGGQYPVKLSTKIQEIIELGRAANAASQLATWIYEEAQGNPNPNRPGSFYMNRTLSKIEVGGTAEIQPDATLSPSAAIKDERQVDWDAKERRDYRSRAWAQTIAAFSSTIGTAEAPEDVYTRLKPFQVKIYYDVTGEWGIAEDVPF